MRRQLDLNPLFTYLMFSDETLFTNEQINRHNMYYWSDINLHWWEQFCINIHGPLVIL